ncbi:MAG: RNA pseudouridine synthase [Muribaculaceae bacterium]|nr:RNA pseudouridine synthase [Muribaculaceae bacterium]
MNNPFDYIPSAECEEAFRKLVDRVETLKGSGRPEDINFCSELGEGKMLGVLIAKDKEGLSHTLYAFSGQLGDRGFHFPGFVEPVFDYLQPDGYFKTKEREISQQNREITLYEEETLAQLNEEYEQAKRRYDAEIAEYKERSRLSKLERKTRRESGLADEAELTSLIKQSQFEKAELNRLKKRLKAELEPFESKLKEAQSHLAYLKDRRRSDSEALQDWLFTNFRLLNARGEWKSLKEIFAETTLKIPPSGAGECCAPKLLQSAYLRGWQPVAMAEYWYGKPKGGEVRRHGESYPACRGKCLPVLSWMLQGLPVHPPVENECHSIKTPEPEIIYENRWFCVVNKPSGMLSVPGKGPAVSLQKWLEEKYGPERSVKLAHRLDQDTSGLVVATFGDLSFKVMQSLFARRRVRKTYIADLEGDYVSGGIPGKGRIELPLSPDWLDRPRQRVDHEGGKEAVTEYEFVAVSEGRSRIEFHPLTGRTHQLRVHAASESGLGMPIAGDRLYGNRGGKATERLHLHAKKIEFTFPIDKEYYSFELPVPF